MLVKIYTSIFLIGCVLFIFGDKIFSSYMPEQPIVQKAVAKQKVVPKEKVAIAPPVPTVKEVHKRSPKAMKPFQISVSEKIEMGCFAQFTKKQSLTYKNVFKFSFVMASVDYSRFEEKMILLSDLAKEMKVEIDPDPKTVYSLDAFTNVFESWDKQVLIVAKNDDDSDWPTWFAAYGKLTGGILTLIRNGVVINVNKTVNTTGIFNSDYKELALIRYRMLYDSIVQRDFPKNTRYELSELINQFEKVRTCDDAEVAAYRLAMWSDSMIALLTSKAK